MPEVPNIHGLNWRVRDPNHTKMEHRIAMVIAARTTTKERRRERWEPEELTGRLVAKAKSNHHQGCGVVPRR
jgi:hypothetical protein